MKSGDQSLILLKKCYKLLESIEDDGWIIKGSNSTEIRYLLSSIRPIIYTNIAFTEKIGINFSCIDKSCQMSIRVDKDNNVLWSYYICPMCEKVYRIVWKHDDTETFVIACDEEKQ